MLGLLIGKSKSSKGSERDYGDEHEDTDDEGTEVAAKAILSAIASKDAKKLAEALKAFLTLSQE